MLTMLQTLCIKTIVEHIDTFCAAYRSTDTAIPQRHFEFLQRIYSQNLITTLSDERKLCNKHLDLLINKHVKEFNLEHFEKCDWEIVEEKLLHIGDTIGEINQGYVKRPLENLISQSRNLESLYLTGNSISDDTLTIIGRSCPSLKVLDISGCSSVTTQGLMNLCNSDPSNSSSCQLQLKRLSLDRLLSSKESVVRKVVRTSVDDSGVSFVLRNMPTLEILDYEDLTEVLYRMHETDGAEAKQYNITSLQYHVNRSESYPILNAIVLACVYSCPRLKYLTITAGNKNSISDDTLTIIGRFCPVLELLDISGCSSVTTKGLMNLCNSDPSFCQVQLKCLNVLQTSVDDSGIAFVLRNMPTLEILDYEDLPKVLYSIHETDGEEAEQYNISALHFYDNEIKNYAMENAILSACVSSCPRVKNLTLTVVGEKYLYMCSKFTKLETINVSGSLDISINRFLEARGTELRDVELCMLSVSAAVLARSCPKLKNLTLRTVQFNDAAEWNISPLGSLQSLHVDYPLSDKYPVDSVSSLLDCCPNLEELRLRNIHINNQKFNKAILKCMRSLKEIHLSNCDDVTMPYLESILMKNVVLEKLTIASCIRTLLKREFKKKSAVNICCFDFPV